MFKKIIRQFIFFIKNFLFFLLSISAYIDFLKTIKFIIYGKREIKYYKIRPRYGQFVLGFYMFLSSFRNSSIIFFLDKNIIYKNFNEELKKIFSNKNCLFIESEFLYQVIRFFFKDNKCENFILNYHPTESLKNKNMFNYDIKPYLNYQNNNSIKHIIDKNYLNKYNIKKIIVIAIKEKKYYCSYKNLFKNYIQPDYEFDSCDRLNKVLKYLCDKNYLVIRSGRYLKRSNFKHNHFFDYASLKNHNNFANDLYIASICDFLIGNMTGYDPLCYLWFKKKIFYYQIRCYKYLLHFPNIFFSRMNIKENKILLNLDDQIKKESLLWRTENANDLYKSFNENSIKVNQSSVPNIIKNISIFLRVNNKNINNSIFYNKFFKYYSKIYKKIGKYLPVYKANLISNS